MTDPRASARKLVGRLRRRATADPAVVRRVRRLRGGLPASRARVDELEAEIQEARRLQERVAELTDLAAEVLISAADRDDPRVRAALERYLRQSF